MELALIELLSPYTSFSQKMELNNWFSFFLSFKRDVHPPARAYLNERAKAMVRGEGAYPHYVT